MLSVLLNFLKPISSSHRRMVERVLKALTAPQWLAHPSEVTNIRSLKKRIKPGDVLLIAGNARISHVVRLLTMSQWSHVVLYVGDRQELLTATETEEWTARFGKAALKHLVIDADPVRRVHLKPMDDYVGLMLRHCRPQALREEDRKLVIQNSLEQLGRQYDIGHIIRLMIFFAFPWELLPQRLRQMITDFTLSESDRICSRVLSEAFHSVGYPIRPVEVVQPRGTLHKKALGVAFGLRYRRRSTMALLKAGKLRAAVHRMSDSKYAEIHLRQARHITPADYDLSRFFAIIKDADDLSFDYRSATKLCPIPGYEDSMPITGHKRR